jgi:hypothetical protein
MLSEDERNRICAEEEVRWKTNRKLSDQFDKSPGHSVWFFLNSDLGLWLLSTLAVGGLTALYTHIHSRVVEQQAKRQRIERLDLEIEGRLSQLLVNVERMIAKPYDSRFSLSKNFTRSDIRQCWRALKMPPGRSRGWIMTEANFRISWAIGICGCGKQLWEEKFPLQQEEVA